MTTRPSKIPPAGTTPPPQEGTPKFETGSQDHHFGIQFAFDVNKQLGKLETGLDGVDKRLAKVETKLDQVQIELARLQTTTTHIEALMKTSMKAIWTVAGGVGVFLLGILSVWIKHRMHW